MTTTQSTYSLVERDALGRVVNTIPGLTGDEAQATGVLFDRSTAHQDKARTWEIVRELTAMELRTQAAERWLADSAVGDRTSASFLADCLNYAAERMRQIAPVALADTRLSLTLHVVGAGDGEVRRDTVDLLAAALTLTAAQEGTDYRARNNNVDVFAPDLVVDQPEAPAPADADGAQS